MSRTASTLALFAALFVAATALPRDDDPKWKLTWADEFDGTELDPKKWGHDVGNGFFNYDANQWIAGWGNGELQYYTREPDNAAVKDGFLTIRALKESLHGFGYTSARLKTRKRDGGPLFNQKFRRFEIRAKLPTGQGVWPAIWMLPQEESYGGWAASGEIDILEARGQKPNEILGTLHFGSRWPGNAEASTTYKLPGGATIADFHVYAIEWEPGEVRWYFDGKLYATQSSWWSSSKVEGGKGVRPKTEADVSPWPAPFDKPFYVILNVAVGGKFVGPPDKTARFPAEMVVDYVRAYEKVGGYGPPKPRGPAHLPFKAR